LAEAFAPATVLSSDCRTIAEVRHDAGGVRG
jgi:hypothetical protein